MKAFLSIMSLADRIVLLGSINIGESHSLSLGVSQWQLRQVLAAEASQMKAEKVSLASHWENFLKKKWSWPLMGVADFIFLASKITMDGDCSHKIKKHSLEGKLWPTEIAYSKTEILLCQQRSISVQFSHSVMSDSMWSHESQYARPPCPLPTPGVHSDTHPSSQWCHPAISSSVLPSPPAPNPSQHQSLCQWVKASHEVAKVLEFQL